MLATYRSRSLPWLLAAMQFLLAAVIAAAADLPARPNFVVILADDK
jgi:hypothetical protein